MAELTQTLLDDFAAEPDAAPLRRCLLVLAAAAGRHDNTPDFLLARVAARPELAVYAPPVINLVITHGSTELATAVEAALPRFRTDLLRPARDLANHLVDVLSDYASPQERARRLDNLGGRLSEVGDKRAALKPAKEAVQLYRQLAEAEPAAYLPNLATALINLGVRLLLVGDKQAALEHAREAVQLYRGLAEPEPAAYLPELARALWAFAWVCVACNVELDEGIAAVEEAIRIYDSLVAQLPHAFATDLVGACRTLADLSEKLGRTPDAEDVRRWLDQVTTAGEVRMASDN